MSKRSSFVIVILAVVLTACQPGAVPATGATFSTTPNAAAQPSTAPTQTRTAAPAATTTHTPTASATPTLTASTTPAGLIRVDTLEQEVYPYPKNGNCSLAEAITAVNLQKQVDGCAPGGENASTIELIPGTYRLTERDTAPQQLEWVISTSHTGNALPTIGRPLTIRGNGAVLSRQDASEPFRIFEVLHADFFLENITLEGGEVRPDDFGGALLAQNVSMTLDGVTVRNSKAEYGGGVYFTFGGLTVRNSIFEGNKAFFSGGGLYADSTRAEITGSRFTNNLADAFGGGLYIQQTFATITDNIFIANRSQANGGGAALEKANATVLRNQFYNNFAKIAGGGFTGRNYISEEDTREYEVDPMIMQEQSPFYQKYATQVPGYRATLVAHPSGMYVLRKLLIDLQDNCFVGNLTPVESDLDIPSDAIAGKVIAHNNYYGHPSGPGGMGSGQGQAVGKMVEYLPFLKEAPAHCDLSLAGE